MSTVTNIKLEPNSVVNSRGKEDQLQLQKTTDEGEKLPVRRGKPLQNGMLLDQGGTVARLLQTPVKAIKLAEGGADHAGTDADLALFLVHMQAQVRDGLPAELVTQQISEFAEKSRIQTDLVRTKSIWVAHFKGNFAYLTYE